MRHFLLMIIPCFCFQVGLTQRGNSKKLQGIYLSEISWTAARNYLTPDAVVIIPLGAGAKEHGPHLPLGTDQLQTEYYVQQIAQQAKVVIAPTVTYSYYPPFLQYAGSTSLSFQTGRDLLLDVVRSLAGYGPKRFYVVNEGITTVAILQSAQKILKEEGILFYFSDYLRPAYVRIQNAIKQQAFGGHAAEIETSNILYIRPDLVDMNKAVNDTAAKQRKGFSLTPVPDENGSFSPSGIVGYAKLATKAKGKKLLESLISIFLTEIDSIRLTPLPSAIDRAAYYKSVQGNYQTNEGKVLTIKFDSGHLEYIFNNNVYGHFYPLYYNGEDDFSGQHLQVKFIRNEQNEVIQVWASFMGQSSWMKKITQ
jgi:creatinine amidohydrolase